MEVSGIGAVMKPVTPNPTLQSLPIGQGSAVASTLLYALAFGRRRPGPDEQAGPTMTIAPFGRGAGLPLTSWPGFAEAGASIVQ
jgi:hypothetical protein